ncbi:UDP-4-amino-4,6-dideoxy-N-acetyl-beta-L-altrosamine transaminase [Pelagicoccus albus]|uniref:UDP-4-amino-4, 6-dideoxy-N-acetyl-beta-L-altrosamine transaminase n=1 Tax=Pelagicoccus albus TaxID=415222 RepID=A0A7X1E9G9_9BACT|nr:UDP-4-amino-4,6-dideoxy-N-acetyl-beta-L-altrosamine transaminase [Pelagicoccus albus]
MEFSPHPIPIPYGRQSIDDSDIAAVVEALKSEFVAQGPRVDRFESALCEVTGARYAIAVSSGTAALHLSCLGLGVEEGDVGIVPAITFAATANCLRYVGASPRFCDVDAKSGIAGPREFQNCLESDPSVKVMLPVSYSGAVTDLAEIARLAKKSGSFVVEDAAHSLGAEYSGGCRSGSCEHSDAAILSFHPVKHICSGEGGAVLTNDKTLADRIRKLRSHGIERREAWLYNQTELGYHYRMTDLQAALGVSQLARLPSFLQRRRDLAVRYQTAFSEFPFSDRIRIASQDHLSARHLFVIHFSESEERDAAYRFFHEHNVKVQVHYMPVYRHSYYKEFVDAFLPGAESFYSTCLSLPLFPALKDEEQEYVIECLRRFLEK